MKESENRIHSTLKEIKQFESLINQMRDGTLHHTNRELIITNHSFKFTFGSGDGIVSVYEGSRFITNIQVESDFIKVTSKVIEGKVVTYNLRKGNPILSVICNDILSEYIPLAKQFNF